MIVYLAGGINGLSDADARDWREHAKANLNTDTLDPMRRDYRGRELDDGIAAEIVAGDLADINASDLMFASCVRPSWGTAMEVFYASYVRKIPVVAVVPEGAPSPWLLEHAMVYRSFEEAIGYINDLGRVASMAYTQREPWEIGQ